MRLGDLDEETPFEAQMGYRGTATAPRRPPVIEYSTADPALLAEFDRASRETPEQRQARREGGLAAMRAARERAFGGRK